MASRKPNPARTVVVFLLVTALTYAILASGRVQPARQPRSKRGRK